MFSVAHKQNNFIKSLETLNLTNQNFVIYDNYIYEKESIIGNNTVFFLLSLITVSLYYLTNNLFAHYILNSMRVLFLDKFAVIFFMICFFFFASIVAEYYLYGDFFFPYFSSKTFITIKTIGNFIYSTIDTYDLEKENLISNFNYFTRYATRPYDSIMNFSSKFVYLLYSIIFYLCSNFLFKSIIIAFYSLYYTTGIKENKKKVNNLEQNNANIEENNN